MGPDHGVDRGIIGLGCWSEVYVDAWDLIMMAGVGSA